jgi:hypothetical protein
MAKVGSQLQEAKPQTRNDVLVGISVTVSLSDLRSSVCKMFAAKWRQTNFDRPQLSQMQSQVIIKMYERGVLLMFHVNMVQYMLLQLQ